ncbi:DUF6903 family protein [Paenibacillus macerans]|uniref:DUF6903 family protein n=1 Tax=Paenibacillus macerans TaxID=44252 RepID=UPI003D32212B
MKLIVRFLLLAACIGLVVFGHGRGTSYGDLGLMLAGLAGLLVLLYDYNRKYQ